MYHINLIRCVFQMHPRHPYTLLSYPSPVLQYSFSGSVLLFWSLISTLFSPLGESTCFFHSFPSYYTSKHPILHDFDIELFDQDWFGIRVKAWISFKDKACIMSLVLPSNYYSSFHYHPCTYRDRTPTFVDLLLWPLPYVSTIMCHMPLVEVKASNQ